MTQNAEFTRTDIVQDVRTELQIAVDHQTQVVEKIRYRIKPISLKGCYTTLANDHLTIGLYKYFVEHDPSRFKQNMYTACQLELAAIALDSYQKFNIPVNLLYVLLSDSPRLIELMTSLRPAYFVSQSGNPLSQSFKLRMWQLAVRGNYAELQSLVDKLAKNGKKADRISASTGQDFFSLPMEENKSGLEAWIKKRAGVPEQNPLVEDYLSGMGTLAAKVCWHRGIAVDIDHPMIPMDLMPIRPLDNYDDVYDFLDPGYVLPARGMASKLLRFFKKARKRKRVLRERTNEIDEATIAKKAT